MSTPQAAQSDAVFESVAELFALLSTPVRLKIIGALCNGEKNVSELLAQIDTTQPNMSQHLATLYRAGVLGKRRDSTQIYYRLQSERVATLCRAVCTQVAIELDGGGEMGCTNRFFNDAGDTTSTSGKCRMTSMMSSLSSA